MKTLALMFTRTISGFVAESCQSDRTIHNAWRTERQDLIKMAGDLRLPAYLRVHLFTHFLKQCHDSLISFKSQAPLHETVSLKEIDKAMCHLEESLQSAGSQLHALRNSIRERARDVRREEKILPQ